MHPFSQALDMLAFQLIRKAKKGKGKERIYQLVRPILFSNAMARNIPNFLGNCDNLIEVKNSLNSIQEMI